MCLILGGSCLLTQHYSTIISLMQMNTWRNQNAIQNGWQGFSDSDDSWRRTLGDFEASDSLTHSWRRTRCQNDFVSFNFSTSSSNPCNAT
jgi:hypothetical protein